MSVMRFCAREIAAIADSLWRELGADWLFLPSEVAEFQRWERAESGMENPRDGLTIRMDFYRHFWERVHVANQAQYIHTYLHYGQSSQITRQKIELFGSETYDLKRLFHTLGLVRYNSADFLNSDDEDRLLRYKSLVADRLVTRLEGVEN